MSDTALTTTAPAAVAPTKNFSLTPSSLAEALEFAKLIADSDLAPKDFRGKAGNVLVAVQMGAEVGLSPMQAIQNIAVVNGRPSLWGDAMLAIVQASRAYEGHKEDVKGDGELLTAACLVKRRGQDWAERTFSVADAKRAGLWGKQGPWTQYPKRMLQLRARAFALRDVFPDVLRGLQMAEEVQDIEVAVEAPIQAPLRAPQRKSDLPTASDEVPVVVELTAEPAPVVTVATITAEQWTALNEKAHACKFSREQFSAHLASMHITRGSDIRADEFDDLMASLDAGPRS